MQKTSDKKIVEQLVNIFVAKGLEYIIISPGSRNAPLIIAFANHPKVKAISIIDERSAAFFALGMAQKIRKPVAIASTSGSATLNYAPAISEAYYQQIPLLVITADRPLEWIDQGEGQAIRQTSIYHNYIKTSINLPVDAYVDDDLWYAERLINSAINEAQSFPLGPVHINLPFREPIYEQKNIENHKAKIIDEIKGVAYLSESEWSNLLNRINRFSKILILVGTMEHNSRLERIFERLSEKGFVIISETISNLSSDKFFSTIDRDITFSKNNELSSQLQPDLLITVGHSIISKRIKALLRNNPATEHWNIGFTYTPQDTFKSLTASIQTNEFAFFNEFEKRISKIDYTYYNIWAKLHQRRRLIHNKYIKSIQWSDFVVFNSIFSHIPNGIEIQLGNSTPVRYAQLFDFNVKCTWHSNRGTSGIDGSSSTAVGYAYLHSQITLLITGDISFYYDSNALWNNYLSSKLRIIVINNRGGGIFRYIPGPDTTEQLEEFFETKQQNRTAGQLAKIHNIPYFSASNNADLLKQLKSFFDESSQAKILEVFTPNEKNSVVLREYFNQLNN